jgi:ribonuclease HI
MVTSIEDAVKQKEARRLATAVTKDTPFPSGVSAVGAFDGAVSGGNPGTMGVGYWMNYAGCGDLVRAGGTVGHGSNNEAEYWALILCLRHALRLGIWTLSLRTDSQLIQRQMIGQYKARQRHLKMLLKEAKFLSSLFSSFSIEWVDREVNAHADELSHRIVYWEPTLPPNKRGLKGRVRNLYDFQAAAVRWWWLNGHRELAPIARIFGVDLQVVERIVKGQAYREATFDMPPLGATEVVVHLELTPAEERHAESLENEAKQVLTGYEHIGDDGGHNTLSDGDMQ